MISGCTASRCLPDRAIHLRDVAIGAFPLDQPRIHGGVRDAECGNDFGHARSLPHGRGAALQSAKRFAVFAYAINEILLPAGPRNRSTASDSSRRGRDDRAGRPGATPNAPRSWRATSPRSTAGGRIRFCWRASRATASWASTRRRIANRSTACETGQSGRRRHGDAVAGAEIAAIEGFRVSFERYGAAGVPIAAYPFAVMAPSKWKISEPEAGAARAVHRRVPESRRLPRRRHGGQVRSAAGCRCAIRTTRRVTTLSEPQETTNVTLLDDRRPPTPRSSRRGSE